MPMVPPCRSITRPENTPSDDTPSATAEVIERAAMSRTSTTGKRSDAPTAKRVESMNSPPVGFGAKSATRTSPFLWREASGASTNFP